MSDITYQDFEDASNQELPPDIVEFLISEFEVTHDQSDGDISVQQAGDIWGVSYKTARTRLEALYKEGKLVRLYGKLLSGGHGFFYRKQK